MLMVGELERIKVNDNWIESEFLNNKIKEILDNENEYLSIELHKDYFQVDYSNYSNGIGICWKSYKYTKKESEQKIIEKAMKFKESKLNEPEYKDYVKIFQNIDLKGRVYHTTYGIGYDCLYLRNSKFVSDVNKIEELLNKNGIEYKCEYSDAHWVYRFRISKSKSNLEKVKNYVA